MKNKTKGSGNGRSGRQSSFSVMVIALCVLFAGMGFVCFRLRGGVQVKPSWDGDILPETEIVFYRQDDERWEEDYLGDSAYTMGSSGCLVSCIASALSMESGREVTPGTLNAKFSGGGVYDAEGNLQWEALSGLQEYQVDVYGEVSAKMIDDCLAKGHYPVVRVRMYVLGNIHYVLIVGAKDGRYLCMDPLKDGITELSYCGSRVYAIRCVSEP